MQAEVVTIDTLAITERLQASGISKKHAAAIAREQVNTVNANLATKSDIANIHKEIANIHKEIEQLRLDSKKDITIAMYKTVAFTVTSVVTLMTIIQIVIQVLQPIT